MQFAGAHVEITVRDVDLEVGFYRERFGCRELLREGEDWALLRCGPLDLAVRRGPPIESSTFHFGVRLASKADCEAAFRSLEGTARVVRGYADHGDWADFTVEDPAGYHVQLYWHPDG